MIKAFRLLTGEAVPQQVDERLAVGQLSRIHVKPIPGQAHLALIEEPLFVLTGEPAGITRRRLQPLILHADSGNAMRSATL